MLVGSAVIADTSVDCQILFPKVNVLPSQPCHFPKPETCEISYLYGQDCVFTSQTNPYRSFCAQIQADNGYRMRWNREVDRAIVSSVSETEIQQIKRNILQIASKNPLMYLAPSWNGFELL